MGLQVNDKLPKGITLKEAYENYKTAAYAHAAVEPFGGYNLFKEEVIKQ